MSRSLMGAGRVALIGVVFLAVLAVTRARAQDPADSYDHPPGNVNELTLAGLRPGRARVRDAVARYGTHWHHPSRDEQDIYEWCDAKTGVELNIEAPRSPDAPSGTIRPEAVIQVVTVFRGLTDIPAGQCTATLSPTIARTGRGVALGASEQKLRSVYGKPFFTGPSSWRGHQVSMIVYNFSWAGAQKPQILESSFNAAGRLIKMTLSAQYY